jgi:hypothetical protein
MNKVQKMVMSFAAVAMIVGFSAFTSVSTKKVPSVFFALNETGDEYIRVASDLTANCITDPQLDKCVIGYEEANAPSGESLPVNSHPTPDYESTTNGWATN